MKHHFLKVTLNFSAVILLLALIAAPIYFAKNAAKIAGVKSAAKFLVVSQIEKFPNMALAQKGDRWQVAFQKLGPSQAFLGFLIVNNPTDSTQTYQIEVIGGHSSLFFGEDLDNQLTQITLPAGTSSAVSLFSAEEAGSGSQIVEFQITAAGE